MKTEEILGQAPANDMFPDIDNIYKLHKENVLPQLLERVTSGSVEPFLFDCFGTSPSS